MVVVASWLVWLSIPWYLGLEAPWGHILLAWGAWCLSGAMMLRSRWRLLFANLAAVLLVLGGFEAWLAAKERDRSIRQAVPSYPIGYFGSPHADILGYGPAPGFHGVSALTEAGRTIYRAEYTYDSLGFRIMPAVDGGKRLPQIAFFGCSFTLGEGVQDRQTAPWLLAERAGSAVAIHNFGFHGYGPHQMLSELEHGLVRRALPAGPPVLGIYQAIGDHVRRCAGLALYDNHGPRYRLTAKGGAEFSGHFDDELIPSMARKSLLWRRISNTRIHTDSADVRLWGAIVEASRRKVEALAPGSAFYVVLWDHPATKDNPAMARELSDRGISWIPASALLEGFASDSAGYLIEGDIHPNPLAHRTLADRLWTLRVEPWIDSLRRASR